MTTKVCVWPKKDATRSHPPRPLECSDARLKRSFTPTPPRPLSPLNTNTEVGEKHEHCWRSQAESEEDRWQRPGQEGWWRSTRRWVVCRDYGCSIFDYCLKVPASPVYEWLRKGQEELILFLLVPSEGGEGGKRSRENYHQLVELDERLS